MTLDSLIGKGLRREPADVQEVGRFLARIATKLLDAQNTQISAESRFDIAYEALLQVGLVALRARGLRPDSKGGHHVMALQTLNLTIGYPREKLRVLDQFRRKRSAGLYDGSFEPSQAELDALIHSVTDIKTSLEHWLATERPELLGGSK